MQPEHQETMQDLTIKAATLREFPEVLALNEDALPHVSSLSSDALRELAEQACYFSLVLAGAQVAGFLLALTPGKRYDSLNYRWFCARYQDFVYVDRIVVAPAFHGQGIGSMLYRDLAQGAAAEARWLTCEVNLQPPNPASVAFHHRLGFVEVGQQETSGGKRVSLLAKPP